MRTVGVVAVCLSLWLSTLQGQQTPAPALPAVAPQSGVLQVPVTDDQTPVPAEESQPGTVIDPKTGLPVPIVTPDVEREKEIRKYDPLDRTADLTGQNVHPLTDRELPTTGPNQNTRTAPLPGSVAASNASRGTGADNGQFTAAADATASGSGTTAEEYTGPAVLSRSYTLARPMVLQQLRWKASLGFGRAIDIGQTQAMPNPDGSMPSTLQSSIYSWSLNGRHIWKHDQLGVSYQGSAANYGSGQNLNGTNGALSLDYAHMFSRRLSVQFVESLSMFSQNYALENPTLAPGSSIANIDLATSPSIQVLDDTVKQSASTATLTFQKSARMSYSLSTSYFFVTRGASGLTGMMGRQASTDVNYRWTRKATVGAYYSYTNYRYSHDISESNSQGAGAIFSYALNRSMQLRTRFGATRIESLGFATIPLPPSLAAILGQKATIVDAYSSRLISDISVELVKDFRRGRTASLAYVRGMSPGNGLLLTSLQETFSAGYSAMVFRRLPLNSSFTYSALTATSQSDLGFYKSETLHLGTSRALKHGLSTSLNFDYRRFDISGSPLLQHDLRIELGVSWSPPENSLRF